jgi:serine kinase of HPr protein (carbohydrate metabolism regulator)
VQVPNLHASAILLGDRGILIAGESGSGKTTLALALIDRFTRSGQFSRLVCDDQVLLVAAQDRLICRAPQTIGGLVEVYGLGPRPLEFESQMIVDLLVRLVPPTAAQRFPEGRIESLAGCSLPCLELVTGNVQAAVFAVASWFSVAPFR